MKKQFFALAGAALASIATVAAGGAPAPQSSSNPAPKTAGEQFKNIQVLKAIPADQLIPTMQFISASLGVECDFCHVEREFDKDDKKTKKTAREMMTMMFAVNKENFKGEREVTCNTCHRGSIHPQAIPAILAEAPKPGEEKEHEHDAAPATLASGDPVMAKYLEAVGGKAALDKVATRTEKGNALMPGGRQVPIEIFAKAPDQRVSVMHTPNGDSVTAYNGHEGWLTSPGRPVRDMSASDQFAARMDAAAFFPEYLARSFDELKLQPKPETIGDHTTVVVLGFAKGQSPAQLYFDEQSGLLLRLLRYSDTALGLNPTQVDFADYRDAGGVKTPYRWTIARPSGAFTIQLDDVKSNAPIDAAQFVKPAAPAALGPDNKSAH
jgi:outer membrane lipoprotein-sorting protein